MSVNLLFIKSPECPISVLLKYLIPNERDYKTGYIYIIFSGKKIINMRALKLYSPFSSYKLLLSFAVKRLRKSVFSR